MKTSVSLIHKKGSIRHDEEWHIDLFGGCYCFGAYSTVAPSVPDFHLEGRRPAVTNAL